MVNVQQLVDTWGPWLSKADQLKSGAGARIYLNVPRETLAAQLRAQSEQQGDPNVPTGAPTGGYMRHEVEPNRPYWNPQTVWDPETKSWVPDPLEQEPRYTESEQAIQDKVAPVDMSLPPGSDERAAEFKSRRIELEENDAAILQARKDDARARMKSYYDRKRGRIEAGELAHEEAAFGGPEGKGFRRGPAWRKAYQYREKHKPGLTPEYVERSNLRARQGGHRVKQRFLDEAAVDFGYESWASWMQQGGPTAEQADELRSRGSQGAVDRATNRLKVARRSKKYTTGMEADRAAFRRPEPGYNTEVNEASADLARAREYKWLTEKWDAREKPRLAKERIATDKRRMRELSDPGQGIVVHQVGPDEYVRRRRIPGSEPARWETLGPAELPDRRGRAPDDVALEQKIRRDLAREPGYDAPPSKPGGYYHKPLGYQDRRTKVYSNLKKWISAWTQAIRGRLTKENKFRCGEKNNHYKRLIKWKKRM